MFVFVFVFVFVFLDSVKIFPFTVSALGGSLLAISGPCFHPTTILQCDFGDSIYSRAAIASPLRAYCPVLYQDKFGRQTLVISDISSPNDEIIYTSISYTAGKYNQKQRNRGGGGGGGGVVTPQISNNYAFGSPN